MKKNSQNHWQNDSQTNLQCLSKSQIASLFSGWKKIFKTKINDEDWLDDTVIIWHIALNDLMMTQDEFNQAKRKSLSLSWPPTAPADFLALARDGQQNEYPSSQTAFEIACQNCGMRGEVNRDWKHPTVREAANRIGWGKLAAASNGFIKYFEQVYKQVIAEHQNGATFEIPKSHRVENKHIPAPPDFVDELLRRHGFNRSSKT